jgi:small subunit ribosomal protein S6
MAKITASYETVIVLNTKLGEEGIKALVEKFKNLIEENGTLDELNEWGKRKLAYTIEDETEGYYVLFNYTCKPDFPAELDRVFKITDGVLRSLITVK